MKGLILTYVISFAATIAGLRFPLFALCVYIGLGIMRPQEIFAFAGDIRNLSVYVGLSVLAGWTFKQFGVWQWGRARASMMAFFLFLALFLVSAALALNTVRSYDAVYGMSKLFLPFLAGVTLLNRDSDWKALMWTVVLTQGYVGFEQNVNYLVKGFNTAQEGFGGMDNNFFGLSLVTTIGPAMSLALSSEKLWQRGLAALATALILHSAMLTFSRGAMVGLLAVGVVAFILMPKRPAYIGALVIVALLAIRLTGPQLLARYATTFVSDEDRDASAESRVDLWKDCLKVIQQYPMLGVGPANWRTIAASFGWSEGKSAHSVWMESAAEIGLPGVFALFSFFALTAIKLLPIARARQHDGNRFEAGAAFGVILGITGFVVSGQFVSAPGLEIPYYVSLVGLGILKNHRHEAATVNVPAAVRPTLPTQPIRSMPTARPAIAKQQRV